MSRSRRRTVVRAVAPVAGLLAAGLLVWQGSYAAFSATTSNSADTWSTGTLVLTNNGGTTTYLGSTSALFKGSVAGQPENNLKIGSTGRKCITVQSTGSLVGALKMYRGTIGGTNGALLAPQMSLTIDAAGVAAGTNVAANCTNFPAAGVTSVAGGVALSALPTSYATATVSMPVAAGTRRVAYRIGWTVTTTGTTAGDNALTNSSVVADLIWEIQ